MADTNGDLIQGKAGPWEMVIGLEVHAQVIGESKLFSGAATAFGAEPNSQVSLVDAAMPGMLPVLNGHSVAQAVKSGLGLNAKINLTSVFERKNYFYPDLPQGYQISQYLEPIVGEGILELDLPDGSTKEVGIERLHMEQDAGKSLHDQHPSMTYIDLNRSGVTLMEIVSKPDMGSAEEAVAYITKLRAILRYLGTCDGNMEEGSLRCDVNLSMRRPGESLGTRTETKNVNSIRFVKQAIEYEAKRQVQVLEDGGEIVQETRMFDSDKGVTRSMRSKEEAHDYRYFPDPDLLPLVLDPDWIEELRRNLPELPDAKKKRFVDDLGLSAYNAGVLVADKEKAVYFENLLSEVSKLVSLPLSRIVNDIGNWVLGELSAAINNAGISIENSPVGPKAAAGLHLLIYDGTISGRIAKDVFEAMWDSGQDAATIVADRGLKQISDTGAIGVIVEQVIADNPGQVAQFKSGNEKILGWFVGQVMKASRGQANPGLVNKVLRDKLS